MWIKPVDSTARCRQCSWKAISCTMNWICEWRRKDAKGLPFRNSHPLVVPCSHFGFKNMALKSNNILLVPGEILFYFCCKWSEAFSRSNLILVSIFQFCHIKATLAAWIDSDANIGMTIHQCLRQISTKLLLWSPFYLSNIAHPSRG